MNSPDIHLCKYDLNNSKKNDDKKHSPINIMTSKIFSFIPILTWLPKYKIKDDLIPDIISGITTGILHVPQGIAYAKITDVLPVYGLYVSFLAPLIYMFFGTSKHASLGTSSFICLMAGVTTQMIKDKYNLSFSGNFNNTIFDSEDEWKKELTNIEITTASTFTIGLILTLGAIFRFKIITTYMPDSLIKGFTTGAAFHVALSQIDDIMGVNIPRFSGIGNLIYKIIALFKKIPHTNIYTFIVSIITLIFYYLGDNFITPFIHKKTKKKFPIPYEVISMIIFTIISSTFLFQDNFDMSVVGDIPTDIPSPQLPYFKLIPDLIGNCILISLVNVTIHLSMVKMLATKYRYEDELKTGQEIYALGFTSILSSFFPVFPSAMAMSRTMVLVNSGGKTQLTNLFSSTLLAFVILYLGPYLFNLPMCVLSITIIYALRSMFSSIFQVHKMFQESKYDGGIYLVSLVVTIFADIVYGLIVSIIFALFTIVIRTQNSKWSLLFPVSPHIIQPLSIQSNKLNIDKIPEISRYYKDPIFTSHQPLFAVHRFEGSLIFTNGEEFRNSCIESIKELKQRKSIKYLDYVNDITTDIILILDFSRITEIDLVGIKFLKEVITTSNNNNIQIIGANVNESVLKTLEITGVTKTKIIFYDSLQKAITSITSINGKKKKIDNNFIVKL
ncbi:FI18412p1 [Strongyloides ratti]|uniref:FI18412p1 n=1 Tax=Strongyloides ratti TaxID=34506 RepID=A0A090LMS3_STRRB|nr:FI18412p1 [Strongyloides ratti]CEF68820.1 FI18412p1 [Strongyloides ratti]